ncbi:hypothetical protein ANTQUA_LOCUS6148 [Anthophora quadrimaculata]
MCTRNGGKRKDCLTFEKIELWLSSWINSGKNQLALMLVSSFTFQFNYRLSTTSKKRKKYNKTKTRPPRRRCCLD